MSAYSPRFIAGMVLLLTNQVVGWAGILGGAYLCKKTGKKIYYAFGTGVYVLSWGMVALGAWLAGPEGIELLKALLKKFLPQTLIALGAAVLGAAVYYYLKKRNKSNAGV